MHNRSFQKKIDPVKSELMNMRRALNKEILCPRSCHVDQFTFHISLPSLKKKIHHRYSRITKLTLFRCLQSRISSLPKAPP